MHLLQLEHRAFRLSSRAKLSQRNRAMPLQISIHTSATL